MDFKVPTAKIYHETDTFSTALAEYHSCLGELIARHGGTLERFMADGLLIVFNDPLPCTDHTEKQSAWRQRN